MLTTTRPLDGRVVLLTGATAGIGRATALRLAGRGATVVACARGEDGLAALAAESPRIVARRCDVSSDVDRAELVEATVSAQGRIDALVNNVGIGWSGLVEEMTVDQIRRLFEVNVVAALDLTRLVLPHMLDRRDGDVVFVASAASWFSAPPLSAYAATKYALAGFSEGLRREVATRGVRVHSIHPGLVSTQFAARSAGAVPGEVAGPPASGPGFPPSWVAAAIERTLTRPAHDVVAVPRLLGLTRVVKLPPLRQAADLLIAANAQRIARVSRRIATREAGAGVR